MANTFEQDHGQSLLALLSNEMVRVYKELHGRGPTKARTAFAGSNTVVCTLEDSLTAAERRLVTIGEHERLREARTFMQYASRATFCEPVERITGRKVRGFVSGIDTQQDISTQVFYLETEG